MPMKSDSAMLSSRGLFSAISMSFRSCVRALSTSSSVIGFAAMPSSVPIKAARAASRDSSCGRLAPK